MARVAGVKPIHKGWSSFSRVTLEEDDGTRVDRLVEDHGSAACVLPYDPVRRVAVLVRQPRAPVVMAGAEDFPEPPAGIVEDGEDPAACARREAEEETGLRLRELEPLGAYWSSPGVTTERTDLFLAAFGVEDRVGHGGGVDEHENLEVLEVPLSDLAARAECGELQDLKLFAMVQALMRKRPALFD